MPTRRFAQVDVFTTVPYLGNPVAVVLDADGLEPEQMQRFARWTNLSETTFLLPAQHPAADYRVRIFTPSGELPFAGHPTLGSCHAWLESGAAAASPDVTVQECAAGLVRVRRRNDHLVFAAPPLRRSGPVAEDLVATLATSLRLDRSAVQEARWVDNGPGWVGLLLDSAEEVLAVQPGRVDQPVGLVGPCPSGSPEAFEVRAFFPVGNMTIEDPVTGSLNAGLADWLLASGHATAPYVSRQGTALGRAGRVHHTQDEEGVIWTGGGTITCVRGQTDL